MRPLLLMLFCGVGLAAVADKGAQPRQPARGIGYWDVQRKGANCFNRVPSADRFRAARAAGIQWLRLVPDKWKGAGRDFLLGNADAFQGIPPADLARLVQVLDMAAAEGHAVVLGMLSLPGCRWVQLNRDEQDYRLWQDFAFQEQAAAFWKELASRLRGHPAIVAYNPLNEPHPERAAGHDDADAKGFEAWLEARRGTPSDLDRFNARIVSAIRSVDADTPILLEGYGHGSASGLAQITPIDDPPILYSFHFYDPWQYTARRANRGRYAYPAKMPAHWDGPGVPWTRRQIVERMAPVVEWASRHGISKSHIVAAEFGCDRRADGAADYLADVVTSLDEQGWHWAFYSYREDAWDGMDYELGSQPLGAAYWEAVERGETPPRPYRDNPIWDVFKRELLR